MSGPPVIVREKGTAVTIIVSRRPAALAVTHTEVALNATAFTKNAVRTWGASEAGMTVATPALQELTVTGVASGLPNSSRSTTKERKESATASVRALSSNARLFGVPTCAAVGSSLQAATRARAASAPCSPKIREFMRASLDGLPAALKSAARPAALRARAIPASWRGSAPGGHRCKSACSSQTSSGP